MAIHRYLPATDKHERKTACGIKLVRRVGDGGYQAIDGYPIATTAKGEPFDCPRCRKVLELHHADVVSNKSNGRGQT